MKTSEFLEAMNSGITVENGSALHMKMHELSQEALRLTMRLNNEYYDEEEVRNIFTELSGREPGEKFGLFPPFYTDCGKNIHVGNRVFLIRDASFRIRVVFS